MANRQGKSGNSDRFYFLGLLITVDGDYSHEIKRRLLLGRKVMTNLDSILKSRGITLPTKVHIVRAMVFPVVINGCKSWTIKKAECQRIDAFELWCGRRLLRVSRTARRLNQSIWKEINPEYSLEGLMLKLKLQWLGHLMQRADSLEKTLMLGTIEGRRRRGWQRMRWLDGIMDPLEMSLSKLRELVIGKPGMLQSMELQRVKHNWVTEQQQHTAGNYWVRNLSESYQLQSLFFPLQSIQSSKIVRLFPVLQFQKYDYWKTDTFLHLQINFIWTSQTS